MDIAVLTHGFASAAASQQSGIWDGITAHSVICFNSVLPELTSDHNAQTVNLLRDDMTTTFWDMTAAAATITAQVGGIAMDWVGLGPGNWQSAGANVQVWITDLALGRVLVGESVSQPDFKPLLFTFEKRDVITVEIVITKVGTDLSMTVLSGGARIDMPKTPDVGYMPGFLNNLDEVTDSATEGNAFGVSRVVPRGWEENAPFSDLEMKFIRDYIPALIAHKGKPIFFNWNVEEYPLEVIFGRFDLAAITYNNVLHGGISLNIRGVL